MFQSGMPRLPPSLKWLIDRRARVAGEIEKIERLLAKCQSATDDLSKLKELLASVDQTLALHEIRVDPEYIRSIRSKDVRVSLPHGELGRAILLCLRSNEGRPVSSEEIIDFVAVRMTDLAAPAIPRAQLARSVHNRLQGLHRRGLLNRHHNTSKTYRGIWSIRS